jgi:hypothetical protein
VLEALGFAPIAGPIGRSRVPMALDLDYDKNLERRIHLPHPRTKNVRGGPSMALIRNGWGWVPNEACEEGDAIYSLIPAWEDTGSAVRSA